MNFPRRNRVKISSLALGAIVISLAGPVAPAAAPPPQCSSFAPGIGVEVTCPANTQQNIPIPSGATVINVQALGAGGGVGGAGGLGGVGAKVVAQFDIRGLSAVFVRAGVTGSTGGAGVGGSGGSLTALFSGVSALTGNTLLVAGAGGGGSGSSGGGAGGAGSVVSTAAGGDGLGTDSGDGGNNGIGGSAGTCALGGGSGINASGGTSAGTGGGGGAGNGGGGGGSGLGGGGAGGSYVATSSLIGFASFSPAGGASGVGGSITFTFLAESLSSGVTGSAPVEQAFLNWGDTGVVTTGDLNSWIQTPASNSVLRPGYNVLGWSTSKDFPLEIAQRQVDRGWGAYETFDSSGRIASVFIPAGGFAFLSGSSTWFPIWAKGDPISRC